MSEPDANRFVAAETSEAAREEAQRLIAAGRAAELADGILAEVPGEGSWRRHHVLAHLRAVPGAEPLLPRFAEALRDGGDAERRNAARAALAALASSGAGSGEAARVYLEHLATDDPDVDVRILAASALGESGNCDARPALERALSDADPNVVSAAADALGALCDPRAVDALAEAATQGKFWSRVAAIVALGKLRDRRAIPALARAATEPLLAEAAGAALGEIGDPAGLDALRPAVERREAGSRRAAERAAAAILSAHPALPAPEWLRAALRGREAELGHELLQQDDDCAARLLGMAGTPEATRALVEAFAREERRPAAATGLALLPPAVAAPAILARLPGVDAEERAALLSALPPLPPLPADALRVVVNHLSDPDEESRTAAAEALGRSDSGVVLPVLLDALEQGTSRRGAAEALARLRQPPPAPLRGLLADPDPRVREVAADGLARAGAADARETIAAALAGETDARARRALVRALGAAGGAQAVATLLPLLGSDDSALRFAVVRALGCTDAPEALPPLLDALLDPDPGVQAAALRSLGDLGDPRAAEPIAERFESENRDVRRTAASALRQIAPAGALDRLLLALQDSDWEIRLAAARTLRRIGSAAAAEPLRRVANSDPDPLVRQAAERALAILESATPRGEGERA